MLKLSLAAVLALSIVGMISVGAAGAASGPGEARLSIQTFPGGAFGHLTGATKRCSEDRKVIVYERQGAERDPATDSRVGVDRVEAGEGSYRWQVDSDRSGDLYARAVARKGCTEVLSSTAAISEFDTGAGQSEYPPCSPYIPEGTSSICQVGLHFDLEEEGFLDPCSFSSARGSCDGRFSGNFPWGDQAVGGPSRGVFNWGPTGNERAVIVDSQLSYGDRRDAGRIEGRVANGGAAAYKVDRAFAEGADGRVEFFTPNLPGQAPGDPGGPLKLNFVAGKLGADVYVDGYLYLKR